MKKSDEILHWIIGFIENKKTITEKEVKNIKKRIGISERFIVLSLCTKDSEIEYTSDISLPFQKYNIVYNE